jgi:phage-related protein
MGYRPLKLPKKWTEATLKELIEAVEDYLYRFTQTRAYDSGKRLSEVEAYLQGLLDSKRLTKKG